MLQPYMLTSTPLSSSLRAGGSTGQQSHSRSTWGNLSRCRLDVSTLYGGCVSPWRSRMLCVICNLSYRLNYLRKASSASRALLASLKIWSYSSGGLVLTADLHECLLKKTKEMFSLAFPEWQHGSQGDWSCQTVTCRGDHSKPGNAFCMSLVTSKLRACVTPGQAVSFFPFYGFI